MAHFKQQKTCYYHGTQKKKIMVIPPDLLWDAGKRKVSELVI